MSFFKNSVVRYPLPNTKEKHYKKRDEGDDASICLNCIKEECNGGCGEYRQKVRKMKNDQK